MGEISKELNSILNDKEDNEPEKKFPKLFIFFLIIFLTIICFAVLFFNKQEETKSPNSEINKSKITIQKKEIPKVAVKKVIKEKLPLVKIDKTNFYKFYNSNNYKMLKCYNYKPADFKPAQTCLESIKKFINQNKNALRYQILAVIGEEDINQYKKYGKNIQDLLLNGLSIKRITEITWYLKKNLGNDIIVTSNNYYVKSSKDNRGILVKAYH